MPFHVESYVDDPWTDLPKQVLCLTPLPDIGQEGAFPGIVLGAPKKYVIVVNVAVTLATGQSVPLERLHIEVPEATSVQEVFANHDVYVEKYKQAAVNHELQRRMRLNQRQQLLQPSGLGNLSQRRGPGLPP